MDTKSWHTNAIPTNVEETIRSMGRQRALEGFYLAGGTGLSLHLGHRISRDLDFFKESFDERVVLDQLQQARTLSVISLARESLHLHVEGVKVSLLGSPYPLLFPTEYFYESPVADPRDIACMKLAAIAGRGAKRDFVDLYVLAKEVGLQQLLNLFQSKFSRVDYSLVHVLKSLTFFEDADKEPMPSMLAVITWEEVKNYFVEAVPRLI